MNKKEKKNQDNSSRQRLIIGRKPLIEAISAGNSIEKIYLQQGVQGEEIGIIRRLAKEHAISISQVPSQRLNKMTKHNHQGVVAKAALIAYYEIEDILNNADNNKKSPFIILLDGVTDIRNLGAIARSAYAFEADAIIIPSSFNAGITEEAIKTSAGALEHIPICRSSSVETAIDLLKLHELKILTSTLEGETKISELNNFDNSGIAVIIGSEERGVGKYALKQADYKIKIPINPNLDSLNASVSAGIIFHHLYTLKSK
ncbi:MAG TPA: 23S rRNA (guanosine(2251)-2'-O)-methyltransferase RlmB [Chitinophagaceae bacterium]|nr:23S rRNA (guanosine(2251)-2'-O)-methyltransferase RlmB [Chitinophagaceae bacterium]